MKVNIYVTYLGTVAFVWVVVALFLRDRESTPRFFKGQKWNIQNVTIALLLADAFRIVLWLLILNFFYSPAVNTVAQVLFAPTILLFTWLFLHHYLKQSWSSFGLSKEALTSKILLGLKWGFISSLVPFSIDLLMGFDRPYLLQELNGRIYRSIIEHFEHWGILIGTISFLALAIFPVIKEEVIYRGMLYTALRKRTNAVAAILVNTFVFTMAHSPYSPAIIMGGVIYAYLYETSRSLLAPIIAHFTGNMMNHIFMFTLAKTDINTKMLLLGFISTTIVFSMVTAGCLHFVGRSKKVDNMAVS